MKTKLEKWVWPDHCSDPEYDTFLDVLDSEFHGDKILIEKYLEQHGDNRAYRHDEIDYELVSQIKEEHENPHIQE